MRVTETICTFDIKFFSGKTFTTMKTMKQLSAAFCATNTFILQNPHVASVL